MMGLAAVAGLLFLAALQPAGAATPDSSVFVEVRESDAADAPVIERWRLYGASHALVIGIDNYTSGWPRLTNAIKDAREVASALTERGFEVELLLDADASTLRNRLRRFFAVKGADPEARLFVWFAGHGHTDYGEGYLVPADAPAPGSSDFLLKALHMGDVGSMVRLARAKHVFSVFDSCFAGTVFQSQRARPPAAITAAVKRPVRQFLTSGDADQQVSDDGTFRKLFVDALKGDEAADLNGDGYLTGSELGFFLEDRIINLTRGQQTPRGGKLRDPRFDRGDFIFLLPEKRRTNIRQTQAAGGAASQEATGVRGPQMAQTSAATLDITFWNAIQSSIRSADYEAYLESFPAGTFAPLARARIAQLAEGLAPESPAPAAVPEVLAAASPASPEPPPEPRVEAPPEPRVEAPPLPGAEIPMPPKRKPQAQTQPITRAEPAAEPAPAVQSALLPIAPEIPAQESAAEPAVGVFPAPAEGTFRDCAVCPEMVIVPAGRFKMGSGSGESGEQPAHKVAIAKTFAVGRFEVTVGQWKACVADGACALHKRLKEAGDDGPARYLSHDAALAYAAWLGRKTGKAYRLLSEAEWEYAARAGTTTAYWWGDAPGRGRADCKDCGGDYDRKTPSGVGRFGTNPFGLHDMNGGVAEWVADCWHKNYRGAPDDGSAWLADDCRQRVLRGGSWRNDASYLRSSARGFYDAPVAYSGNGLRVALTLQ